MKRVLILSLILLPTLSLAENSIDDFPVKSHWTCDETSGVRYDSNTITGNDLTDNNTIDYASGLLGNACNLESTNSEYLSHTDNASLSLETGDFSYSLWVNFESATDGMLITHCGNPSCGYYTHTISGGPSFRFADSSMASTDWSWNPSNGVWYHVVFTFNNTTDDITFYIDGTAVSTQTMSSTLTDSSADFQIGKTAYFNSNYYDGLLDEITIFDYELTSGDVTTLYNSGTPLDYVGSPAGTSTPTTTTATTTSMNVDNITFMLGVIIFFLTFLWAGFILRAFTKSNL